MSDSGHPHHSDHPHRVVRRRRRRKGSPLIRWLRYGPPGQLLEILSIPLRRHPLAISLGAAAGLWWFWPWIRPPVDPLARNTRNMPDVVAVLIEDHRRTSSALEIWKMRPRATLMLMAAGDSSDEHSLSLVRNAALTPEQRLRVKVINSCGDTVTYLADLSQWLASLPHPGYLTLVTSPTHITRTKAIGKVMLGASGWYVEGVGSLSSEYKPESPLRLWRDQLRAQVWRATGWTGKDDLICPGRAKGLF